MSVNSFKKLFCCISLSLTIILITCAVGAGFFMSVAFADKR